MVSPINLMVEWCNFSFLYLLWTVFCIGAGTDQNFIIGCPCFLKKRRLYQTTGANQNFIICKQHFSFYYLFVFLWYYSYMSLLYLSGNSLVFFCFFVVCGALGWVLWLKSKKWNGSVSLPSLIGNYQKSYSYISANIFGWMAAR